MLIFDAVSPALDEPDLVIKALHEAEGDFVVGMAIADDAVPVAFNHGREFLERL